jgi:acetylornithine deacetylase/succinyl-diaminopimelate desuccinylase-like protein
MKNVLCSILAVLIALAAAGCREEARLTILFSGDERGWIVPAG